MTIKERAIIAFNAPKQPRPLSPFVEYERQRIEGSKRKHSIWMQLWRKAFPLKSTFYVTTPSPNSTILLREHKLDSKSRREIDETGAIVETWLVARIVSHISIRRITPTVLFSNYKLFVKHKYKQWLSRRRAINAFKGKR